MMLISRSQLLKSQSRNFVLFRPKMPLQLSLKEATCPSISIYLRLSSNSTKKGPSIKECPPLSLTVRIRRHGGLLKEATTRITHDGLGGGRGEILL